MAKQSKKAQYARQRIYRVLMRIENKNVFLECFQRADNRSAELLRQMMRERPVSFLYRKENGEIARRTGTLQTEFLSDNVFYKVLFKEGMGNNPAVLTYWDITRGGWRSAQASRLIGYFKEP